MTPPPPRPSLDLPPSPPPSPVTPHPRLRERTLVLVGLMGAGKSTIGRALAQALQLPFRDADQEIEQAARRSVAEIFAERGEEEFRDGERRVIARLITQEPPHVLATGGGAFMHPMTRALVRERTLSVWLRADLEVLARRVARKATRPLLVGRDPLEVLGGLAQARYPHYAQAHLVVDTGEVNIATSLAGVMEALNAHLETAQP